MTRRSAEEDYIWLKNSIAVSMCTLLHFQLQKVKRKIR